VEVSDSLARETLEELIPFLDEPLENPTHVGTYLMAKRARELGIKSVITGDGSDEFFLGYDRHAHWFTAKNPSDSYPALCWTMKPGEGNELYTALAKEFMRPMVNGFGSQVEPVLNLSSALQFERTERLTHYHNMRLDLMTMAHGVEAKVPFQDHRIIEYSLRIPPHILIGKTRKEWLSEAARHYLPKDIIDRRKILFPSLPDQWISGKGLGWAAGILLDPGAQIHSWVIPDVMERYIKEHKEETHLRGKLLWALITLELWMQNLEKWRKDKK
jgi:asparagine synthase (glutamine-hydrolysing)